MSKWVFTDGAETYQFEISVNQGGDTTLSRKAIESSNVGLNNTPVLVGGEQEPREETAAGTSLSQSEYTALITWFNKGTVIQVTDQLGTTLNVLLTGLEPKRVFTPNFPWRHDYTLRYLVI